MNNETIIAIATPPRGSLRGIVRLSGDDALTIASQVFRSLDGATLTENLPRMHTGQLTIPGLDASQPELPCDCYCWGTSRSYTGQPSVELHTLGSPPLLEKLVAELLRTTLVRMALPGEFTLRAVLSGNIDLTRAEAILGVIDAKNENDLVTALEQLAGGLANPLLQLREEMAELLAHLEAGFDFIEEDIAFVEDTTVAEMVEKLLAALEQIDVRMNSRHRGGELPRVLLAGEPNVGKSTLFNAVVGDTRAIVADKHGTTRDWLEAEVEIDGTEFILVDSAGVNATNATEIANSPDAIAQQRAEDLRERADVVVECYDATAVPQPELERPSANVLQVFTKCDLVEEMPTAPLLCLGLGSYTELERAIAAKVRELEPQGGDIVPATALRCGESVHLAREALLSAEQLLVEGQLEELVAAEIRAALDGLGQVLGVVTDDDILGRIFSRFCVGK